MNNEISNERLEQLASGAAWTCIQDDEGCAMAKELLALRKFFETGIRHALDGCHFDGGEMQELAVKLGLLREEAYDPEKHRDLVSDPSAFAAGDPVYFIV